MCHQTGWGFITSVWGLPAVPWAVLRFFWFPGWLGSVGFLDAPGTTLGYAEWKLPGQRGCLSRLHVRTGTPSSTQGRCWPGAVVRVRDSGKAPCSYFLLHPLAPKSSSLGSHSAGLPETFWLKALPPTHRECLRRFGRQTLAPAVGRGIGGTWKGPSLPSLFWWEDRMASCLHKAGCPG